MIWRYLPLIGITLFIGVACCWRPWLQFRRFGTWGIVLFRSTSGVQILRDSLAVVAFALLMGQAVVAAGWPEALSPVVRNDWMQVTGGVLLFGGLILLVSAQLQLGASWRIGIEEDAQPGLVTHGLYRFCRNPIFLAILVIFTGYTLLLPTMLSFMLLLGTSVGVRQQTLAEEAYLLRAYGEAYRRYARRVGRFWPGLGRFH
jgi:protein-S-isoprenylcysteine O-methyltransferase Ste14